MAHAPEGEVRGKGKGKAGVSFRGQGHGRSMDGGLFLLVLRSVGMMRGGKRGGAGRGEGEE